MSAKARSTAIWTVVAIVGAVSWGVIALVRGEEISAAGLVAAALGSYAIAYRFYSKFIARKREAEPIDTTETEFVESELCAPAGLIATPEERERERELVGAGS